MAEFTFQFTLNEHGQRLDKALARRLNKALEGGFSRNKTKKLLDAGKVEYNGRVERFGSRNVEYDDIVRVEVDEEVVGSPKSTRRYDLSDDDVLWRDDFVIAVNKPVGLPSQATRDPNRDHLVAAVKRYLSWRGVEDPYVAIHHRLDVGTSGVVVLAVHRRANKRLGEAFESRNVDKTYRALAVADEEMRREESVWTVENHLDERGSGSQTRQVPVEAGGDYARTELEVKRRRGRVYELVARPHTGRRHQIRAHLAGEGMPIVGDRRYGGLMEKSGVNIDRMMLHAHRLRLDHPVAEGQIEVESPIPQQFDELFDRLAE